MRPAATRPPVPHVLPTLYLAFELGNTEWVLAMTIRMDQAPLRRQMPARMLKTLEAEIARAKALRLAGHGAGVQLLRSGARRFLVASVSRQRGIWRLIGHGEGIHWPELDDDISVEGLLAGRRSAASQRSPKAVAGGPAIRRARCLLLL